MRTYIMSYTRTTYFSLPLRAPSLEATARFFEEKIAPSSSFLERWSNVIVEETVTRTHESTDEADEEQLNRIFQVGDIVTINEKGEPV